jgi:hypothetical protein
MKKVQVVKISYILSQVSGCPTTVIFETRRDGQAGVGGQAWPEIGYS